MAERQQYKILVTGAEGFIGSRLLRLLKAGGFQAVGSSLQACPDLFCLDLLDYQALEDFLKYQAINIIINCAAVDGDAKFKQANSDRIKAENPLITKNILAAAEAAAVQRVFLFSSAEIKTLSPDGYAQGKIALEEAARLFSQESNLVITILRPTNIYGPDESLDGGRDRVVASMIKRVISGQQLEIWGDGLLRHRFLFIDDLIAFIIVLLDRFSTSLNSSDRFELIELTGPELISVRDLALKVCYLAGREANLVFLPAIKKADYQVNFTPLNNSLVLTALDDGLRRTIDYYLDKHESTT